MHLGLLDKIFQPKDVKAASAVQGYFSTLSAYTPSFTSYSGGLYEAMQTRAAIHAFANHCSKLKPEVVGSGNPQLKRLLQYKPNPYMTTSQFLYRVATIFACTNNCFIVPLYSEMTDDITGFYPLMPNRTELVHVNGEPYLRYSFANGQKAAIEYSKVGHITQMQFDHDFFGASNAEALKPTLDMIHIQNQGIVEAVKNGASLRFLAKLAQTLKPSTLDAERRALRESNLSAENNGGFLLVDAKYEDVKQINSQPYVVDEKQMDLIQRNIHNYFGTNDHILQNSYSEDEYNAWYESKIEPFAVQLGMALTNMTFTDREVSFGNEIMFSANRLQYASTASKLAITQQLFDRGIMSQNDVCDVWQLPHVEDGDRRFIRGEYINTDNKDSVPAASQGAVPATEEAEENGVQT